MDSFNVVPADLYLVMHKFAVVGTAIVVVEMELVVSPTNHSHLSQNSLVTATNK